MNDRCSCAKAVLDFLSHTTQKPYELAQAIVAINLPERTPAGLFEHLAGCIKVECQVDRLPKVERTLHLMKGRDVREQANSGWLRNLAASMRDDISLCAEAETAERR